MGQTNDEVLTDILVGFEQGYHIAPTTERMEALREAIDILHKYQKIEQIMKDIPYGGMATVRRIEEVIEE